MFLSVKPYVHTSRIVWLKPHIHQADLLSDFTTLSSSSSKKPFLTLSMLQLHSFITSHNNIIWYLIIVFSATGILSENNKQRISLVDYFKHQGMSLYSSYIYGSYLIISSRFQYHLPLLCPAEFHDAMDPAWAFMYKKRNCYFLTVTSLMLRIWKLLPRFSLSSMRHMNSNTPMGLFLFLSKYQRFETSVHILPNFHKNSFLPLKILCEFLCVQSFSISLDICLNCFHTHFQVQYYLQWM